MYDKNLTKSYMRNMLIVTKRIQVCFGKFPINFRMYKLNTIFLFYQLNINILVVWTNRKFGVEFVNNDGFIFDDSHQY